MPTWSWSAHSFRCSSPFLVVYFAVKYRRRDDHVPAPVDEHSIGGMILEIVWSVIPLGLSLVMFAWGGSIFFTESRPPADSLEVFVTGKQWMWKIQHSEGAREINQLHIPINRNIRLTMTSEDVIHDFYVPAFRTKSDVLPGKYTTEWFKRPTKLGEFHIFCAEYCGTKHSGMIGTVYVMTEQDYIRLAGRGKRRRLDGRTGAGALSISWDAATAIRVRSINRTAAARIWSAFSAPRSI